MVDKDLKKDISEAINDFLKLSMNEASINLFKILGYNTERMSPLDNKNFQGFKENFLSDNKNFNEDRAFVREWKLIDLLFQLTANEISNQIGKFDTKKVDNTIIEAYLFFCIELEKEVYSRSQLAQITREINKVFAMPVLIVFKHGDMITISVINRRINKQNTQKDVLEKVTFIKDISIRSPHRAHVEILFDLSFSELFNNYHFTNFVELHNAWQKTLNTKELNKRFYRELSNWYFWALHEVQFPTTNWASDRNSLMRDEERVKEHNAKNLIRLLTRLLFVWFVKEKKLIPDELFDEDYLKENLLKDFEPGKKKDIDKKEEASKYYRAILQNLFFATLNQTVGKREFRKEGQHMNVTNLMRYESYFKNPNLFIELVEKVVPFMNGGLFECLDSPDPVLKGKKGGDVIIYEDGFSDRKDNNLLVPDYIFFGINEHADLSEELGDKKQNYVTVNGLINILKSYKFTVTENTPIEEDVALDPELLGRVFENLLASYNQETKTTARKQTGSFYTPREIVDFMVDESLKNYLKQKLVSEAKMDPDDAEKNLEILISYNEQRGNFDDKEINVLINAIDNCKILDPACGSGAFPMGILHKLVHILHKLDPNNKLWKDRQIKKAQTIEDPEISGKLIEDIETAFENNELDYGRKLYLIENCIYGVDIQPIAIQISKLRFFISLIVDQKSDKNKNNFGIRPLPNLETKFVTANTLVGIEKPKVQKSLFDNQEVQELENKLRDIRHSLFSAKTPKTKRELREKDKEIREKMGKILENAGWSNESSRQLASWDPYNQNVSSPWFDSEWMFGIENGFDIVIGNPPYIQLQNLRGNPIQQVYKSQNYKVHDSNGDIYCLFYEQGINLLRNGGIVTYITSNKWMRAGYGEKLREFFLTHRPLVLIDLGPGVFESATVDTNILMLEKVDASSSRKNNINTFAVTLAKDDKSTSDIASYLKANGIVLTGLTKDAWFIGSAREQRLKEKIERIGKPLKEWDVSINYGIKTGLNEAFIIDQATRDRLVKEDPKSAEIIKPILGGKNLERYTYNWSGLWLIATGFNINVPSKYPAIYRHLLQFEEKAKKRDDQGQNWWNLRACSYYTEFEKEKLVWLNLNRKWKFSYVEQGIFVEASLSFLTSNNNIKFFIGILSSKLHLWYFCKIGSMHDTGGYMCKIDTISSFPVPPITTKNKPIVDKIEALVEEILKLKKKNPEADTKKEEDEIDRLVYQLYELTEEEIKIVEGGN